MTRQLEPNDIVASKSGKVNLVANQYILQLERDSFRILTTSPSLPYNFTYQDGPLSDAQFGEPQHLAVDENENLYVSDYILSAVRQNSPTGRVSTLAGRHFSCVVGDPTDGIGKRALFRETHAIVYDPLKKFDYVIDDGSVLRRINLDRIVETIGMRGQRIKGRENDWQTVFQFISGLVMSETGELYAADRDSYQIKRVILSTHLDLNPLNDNVCG